MRTGATWGEDRKVNRRGLKEDSLSCLLYAKMQTEDSQGDKDSEEDRVQRTIRGTRTGSGWHLKSSSLLSSEELAGSSNSRERETRGTEESESELGVRG